LRRDQYHLVLTSTPNARQLDAEHYAEFAGPQCLEAARLHVLCEIGHLFFGLRKNAADKGAAHGTAVGQQPLGRHIGRGRHHLLVLRSLGRNGAPIGERVVLA
jgi:hypothetical protein